MFDERLQGIDVTSMLDESLQQKISSKNYYPDPKTPVLINHVSFLNFQKTLQANSLYFRRYSTYQRSDEIEYKEYNDLYTRYLPESEQDKCNQRNETLSKSIYVLPMYNSNIWSNLHLERYAVPKGIDPEKGPAINKAYLAVFYNWKRLFSNLKEYAWRKALVNSFKGTPIASLSNQDRIFCGGIQYLDDLTPQKVFFDPANAIVPFFLKERNNEADNEYRLCVLINPKVDLNGQIEHHKSPGIYIQVGNVLDIIDRIFFTSKDGLILKDIKEQFEEMDFVKSNKHNLKFNWNESHNGSIELIIKRQSACTNDGSERHKFCEKEYSFENIYPVELNQSTLYSAKYDSMKQRYILMNGNREYNYKCYNATLKLEMLLFGKVTITDAQYYDGLLFKEMIDHGDFEDFITCSYKHDSLKIKVRCDKDNIIRRMYGKQFYPSSVKSYAIGEKIEEITKDLEEQEEDHINEKCVSISEFVSYLKLQFSNPVPLSIEEELDYFEKYFIICNSVYSSMFEIWEKFDFNAEFQNLGDKAYSFQSIAKISKDISSSDINFKESMYRLGKKLGNCKEEFESVKSFRSAVYSFQSEVLRACEKMKVQNLLNLEQYDRISDQCRVLINEFNYTYNRVISKQHHCRFVDMTLKEYPKPISPDLSFQFDQRLSKYLFLSSWENFDKLLCDPEVKTIRKQLFSFWEKVSSDNFVFTLDDAINLHRLFSSLDVILRNRYLPILDKLDKGMSDYIFDVKASSTDYFRTEKLAFGKGDCGRFIGNGCDLGDSHTDKLRLFLPIENQKMTFFDLCFGNDLDNNKCNTVSFNQQTKQI